MLRIAPDDPRHGTYAGYQAHVHGGETRVQCEPCLAARRRHDKADRLRVARGIPAFVDGDRVLQAVRPWLHMGISATVLDGCIGHPFGGVVVRLVSGDIGSVRPSTFVKLRAITEDLLPDSARVYSDLTRYRIYSLMAAGHRQRDLGINPTGHWRTRDHIVLGHARRLRDVYRRLEQHTGPCSRTATRARNQGFLPPAGWDDPDTLAWPEGWPRPGQCAEPAVVMDEAAIWRRIHGDRTVQLTQLEQDELVRRCLARGWTWRRIETVAGVNVQRANERLREVA